MLKTKIRLRTKATIVGVDRHLKYIDRFSFFFRKKKKIAKPALFNLEEFRTICAHFRHCINGISKSYTCMLQFIGKLFCCTVLLYYNF